MPREREDLRFEKALAAGECDIGPTPLDELRRLAAVRAGGHQDGRTRGERWIGGAQPLERTRLPGSVSSGEHHALIRAVSEHIEESHRPDPGHLAPDPSPQPLPRFADLYYADQLDRKSTRLNSSHGYISYAVFCLKKKKKTIQNKM